MFPDLSTLSQEEAALITDVLSRLSLGSAQPSTQGLQVQPSRGALQDPSLLELDLAAWTIEQELRGLQGSKASSTTFARPATGLAAFTAPPPLSGYTGTTFTGHPTLPVGAYSSAHFSGLPDSGSPADVALLASRHGSHAQSAPSPSPPWELTGGAAMPLAQTAAAGPPFSSANNAVVSTAQSAHNNSLWTVRQGIPSDHQVERSTMAATSSTASQAPQAPEPERAPSLLKEMRERLRQQQNQQAAEQVSAEPVPGAAVGSTLNDGVHTPVAVQAPVMRSATPNDHYARGTYSRATHSSRHPNPARSPHRRIPVSAPSSASKAFTMLNARTSVERYGPEPGVGHTGSAGPAKAPVKLPDQERSARLQQLYERSLRWRRRCDERYAKARHDREASELQSCTFTPRITTASHLIAQGKSPSEAYQELSKSSTPTKHQRFGAPENQHSPAARSSAHTTPIRVAGLAGSNVRTPHSGGCPAAAEGLYGMDTAAGIGAAPVAEACNGAGPATANSPAKGMVSGADVGERLYRRAFLQRARQEERIFRQLLEEERQRRFTASVKDVTPRVYDPPEPPSSRYLPTGMEECTFHPSLVHSSSRRPKSAPHMRAGDGQSLSHLRYDNGGELGRGHDMASLAHSQSGARDASSAYTTVSVSPDLNWEEFLARQERFLVSREYKMQLLEQGQPAMPRMSPGSKKLLREREMRQACAEEGSTGAQGEASPRTGNSSPGRRDRRLRAIMEMYKECTFQPQITRRAAAMPSRKVEDLMDGGRARREEWMEQQRALQEVREVEGATFKPQTLSNAYAHVRPRISLKNPDAYLAHVADKRRQREALRAELETEREALELQHCTFKPQTTPLPPYLIRRLQEQQWEQLQEAEGTSTAEWDEENDDGSETDHMAFHEAHGYDRYDMGSSEDRSSAFRSQAGISGYASMPPDEDVDFQTSELDSYQDAYTRALQYAKMQDL